MADRERLIELLDAAFLESDANYGMPSTSQVADHLIANGVTIQRWIPVTERLPDSGKYVLLYCSDGLYGEGHYRAYENKWYLSKITYKSIPDVTHWMPLPEAPKGE